LGTLTDTNNLFENDEQDVTATLNVAVNFTTPSGGKAPFVLGIGVDEAFNGIDSDGVIDLSQFNGPSTHFWSWRCKLHRNAGWFL